MPILNIIIYIATHELVAKCSWYVEQSMSKDQPPVLGSFQ